MAKVETVAKEEIMAKAQSQPTNPAPAEKGTERTERKEEKTMKKNTAPATSTPAPAKTESKRTPADKTATKGKKKASKKASEETLARVENDKIIVYIVKQTISTTGVLTELKPKEIPMPANAKVDQLPNLANLIQCKVLAQLSEKYASELANIKPKKDQPLTEEQKDKKKLINAKIRLVKFQLEKYGYNADKIALLISEPMAEMLACWVTGEKLSLELNNLKTCLRANYQTISSLLDKLLKDGKASTSEEEKEIFTCLRQALKKDLESYTKESHYFNQFKLSVSITDIRKWYEVSRLDIANDTFIFDDKKDTTLSKAIVKWFLTKLKVEPKDEPASTPARK